MEYIKINSTSLGFNRIIYVDSISGNDIDGDGSKSAPYKTIQKAMSVSLLDNAIKLSGGIYPVAEFKTMLTNKNITFIGDWNKTVIEMAYCPGNGSLDPDASSSFYQIQFTSKTDMTGDIRTLYYYSSPVKLRFYNCAFKQNELRPTEVYFYWHSSTSENRDVNFENCSFININNNGIAGLEATQQLYKNCVFTKLHSTGTQITCLKNATLDTDFNVTSAGWQNSGTGLNPDGTKSNLGVYGGEFGWGEWSKPNHLLKSNNKIYTLNKVTNTLEDITSSIVDINNITKLEFETYGFDDLVKIALNQMEGLTKPVKLLYYRDRINSTTHVPKLRQEYNLNVGVRQMIKKPVV